MSTSFNLYDNMGFKYQVGDSDSGINSFPISKLLSVKLITLLSSDTTVNANSQKNVTSQLSNIQIDNCTFIPVGIVGYSGVYDSELEISSMFIDSANMLRVYLKNYTSSNKTISSFNCRVLYVCSTVPWLNA